MNAGDQYGVANVIHDPDKDCGFRDGAKLNGIYPSLRLGIFTPGTTLSMMGKRYLVVGSVGLPQRLLVRR